MKKVKDLNRGVWRSSIQESPLWFSLLSVVAFVLLLLFLFYLGDRLETIEDQLGYKAPATMSGSTGISRFADSSNNNGINTSRGQKVYVPVYSHIYSNGGSPILLESTISIRNTDPEHAITISSARYFDSKGIQLEQFVDKKMVLGPLETKEFLIEKRDTRGGSGANFIIKWSAEVAVYEPIVEAIMVGRTAKQHVSFKSIGRALLQRKETGE